MSRFRMQNHTIWHCLYHIVFLPKYRYNILKNNVAKEVYDCLQTIAGRDGCEIAELNVQEDHVHMMIYIPPKLKVCDVVGKMKGKTALHIFQRFPFLKKKPYWGNHFWAKGYCADTIGLNEDVIRKYVKYQDDKDK